VAANTSAFGGSSATTVVATNPFGSGAAVTPIVGGGQSVNPFAKVVIDDIFGDDAGIYTGNDKLTKNETEQYKKICEALEKDILYEGFIPLHPPTKEICV